MNKVLDLWNAANASGEDYVLVSIVRVEGSSYRKPGARMLITESGRRTGTISGGCLEAEVSKQAFWLTQNGPVLKAYSTSFETDGDRPYGLGCGGVVHLLLERRTTADAFLQQAQKSFQSREAWSSVVVLHGRHIGERAFAKDSALAAPAAAALDQRASSTQTVHLDGEPVKVWAEYLPPRCGLFVFGAGDDAQPLVAQASILGWQITVADGRSHLATRDRFPNADNIVVLQQSDLSAMDLKPSDAAVVMTHSFDQDCRILAQLVQLDLLYRGVLGPRYRTREIVQRVVTQIGGTLAGCMQKLHAPVGFDLGGDGPASIALSILAEVQATLCQKPASVQQLSLG